MVYEFEVKNKLSGWKAECRLTSKSAMITEEEHVDRIMDLVMKARTYGEVDYELVKQPEQTEYFLKHNRGMSAVYCVQLNEVAKCYMEQHELKKAFDAATKAESYAKLIMEDESSVIFRKKKKLVEPEMIQAKITQAYSLFYEEDYEGMLDKIKGCPKTVEIKLLEANSLYEQIKNKNFDKQSYLAIHNRYRELFYHYKNDIDRLKRYHYIMTALYTGVLNYAIILVDLDGGDTESACRFLESAEELMKSVGVGVYESKIREMKKI